MGNDKRPVANFTIAVIVAVVLFSSTASARDRHEGAFAIFADKDASGHDYKELDGVPLDKCESGCQQDMQCKAFTYNGPSGSAF